MKKSCMLMLYKIDPKRYCVVSEGKIVLRLSAQTLKQALPEEEKILQRLEKNTRKKKDASESSIEKFAAQSDTFDSYESNFDEEPNPNAKKFATPLDTLKSDESTFEGKPRNSNPDVLESDFSDADSFQTPKSNGVASPDRALRKPDDEAVKTPKLRSYPNQTQKKDGVASLTGAVGKATNSGTTDDTASSGATDDTTADGAMGSDGTSSHVTNEGSPDAVMRNSATSHSGASKKSGSGEKNAPARSNADKTPSESGKPHTKFFTTSDDASGNFSPPDQRQDQEAPTPPDAVPALDYAFDFTRPSRSIRTPILLDEKDIAELQKKEDATLQASLFHYLASSEKCWLEARHWLFKRDVSPPQIKALIEQSYRENYLSDERYMRMYVARKKAGLPYPWWRVHAELKQRIKDPLIIEDLSETIGYDDEEILTAWVAKRGGGDSAPIHQDDEPEHSGALARSNSPTHRASRRGRTMLQKWRSRLISRGFNPDLVKRVLKATAR